MYIYISVFTKIGHETSSEALWLLGSTKSYKNLNLYQLSVIHHVGVSDAHGSTKQLALLYVADN